MASKLAKGTSPSPLGSKTSISDANFSSGSSSTKKTARHSTGKNSANAKKAHGGKTSLNFSNKDGQRQAGNPARSGKSKGPSGIKSKKGRLK